MDCRKMIGSVLTLGTLVACALPPMPQPVTGNPAYWSASADNKIMIEGGKIGIGMSIAECQASWPDRDFMKISETKSGRISLETWRVENYSRSMRSMVYLYLYLENGRITVIDEVRKGRP